MSTDVMERTLETGDVIEIDAGDDSISALVLLAADDFVIIDRCDDSTPVVLRRDELSNYRRFERAAWTSVAASHQPAGTHTSIAAGSRWTSSRLVGLRSPPSSSHGTLFFSSIVNRGRSSCVRTVSSRTCAVPDGSATRPVLRAVRRRHPDLQPAVVGLGPFEHDESAGDRSEVADRQHVVSPWNQGWPSTVTVVCTRSTRAALRPART